MAYIITFILTLGILLLETSFLPFLKIFDIVPFVTLAFLIGVSIRTKYLFNIFLAFLVGIFFGSISVTSFWVFPLLFVGTSALGRMFFYHDTGHNSTQAFLTLFSVSTAVFYTLNFLLLRTGSQTFVSIVLEIIVAVVVNIIFGYFVYKIFNRFYDWLDKQAEERFQ